MHLNYSDLNGGAARAAFRIYRSQQEFGIDSYLRVIQKQSDDWRVIGPQSRTERTINFLKPRLVNYLLSRITQQNKVIQSISLLPSNVLNEINQSQANVINLHWVCNEMLSISQISKIRIPVVWTLHDMWPFCGVDHYVNQDIYAGNFVELPLNGNFLKAFINRWTLNRKRVHWKNPIHLIAPSNWMAQSIQQSELMKHWPVTVIPNPIDLNLWKPINQNLAREIFGLPSNCRLILFAAAGGQSDLRKGYDLFKDATLSLANKLKDFYILVLGQSAPRSINSDLANVRFMGHLSDDVSLALLYSAADAVVIPSRQDNLPNIGIEACACGVPVVAFNIGGLPDIVDHAKTGYLAEPYDVEDLANGLEWVLGDDDRLTQLKAYSRDRAINNWGYEQVAKKYLDLYKTIN